MDNNPSVQPLWTVGVPMQIKFTDPQRGFVDGWEIPVVMADKTTFKIQVPADQFNPDGVRALIEDHVDRLVAVRTLQGPTY